MTLTITATDRITHFGGVPCRVWTATTPEGSEVVLFVHRIAVPTTASPEVQAAFERELLEQLPPGRVVPLSMIL